MDVIFQHVHDDQTEADWVRCGFLDSELSALSVVETAFIKASRFSGVLFS